VKLGRWDIVFVPASDSDGSGHPAVVLSHESRLDDPRLDRINVIMGTKKQPAEAARDHHVVLNGADGLEFFTLFDCSFVYVAKKSTVRRTAGRVTLERRREIQRKLRAYLGLG
jgi:hypothetical protein